MFKLDFIEDSNPEGKRIYACRICNKRLIFTNKYNILEYYKDLNNFFKEYYFLLEIFYTRVKSLDLELSNNDLFGFGTARMFLDLDEIRYNIYQKKSQLKSPDDVAAYINAFNNSMMTVCFKVSKKHHIEAENIYHLLTDLRSKFYSVYQNSYELHLNKSLKLFI